MVKISKVVLVPFLLMGGASAFTAPSTGNRAFVSRTVVFAEEEAVAEPAGKLVPVKKETVEFTAGILGGLVGLSLGGPWLAAITAAAANYVSKQDIEASVVISAVAESSIKIYNYLAQLDTKYELLTKAQASLKDSLEKVKTAENVNPETIQKVESALAATTSKINDLNEEYDLVGTGVSALGVVGDLIDKAVIKAGEINSEYKLTDKAQDALKQAVEKAKASQQ
jgi:hypothetical protein